MIKKTGLGLVLAIGASALVACGASEEVATESSTAIVAGEGGTTYPLTIENCGTSVTYEQAPSRVVSLDQGTTEILLSLGLEDRMVGTASWTDPVLPELATANESVPRLADNAPTYEVVMDTDPDAVVAHFGRHYKAEGGVATRERFAETGITTYLSATDCEGTMSINGGGTRTVPLTVDKVYEDIETLAEIFDVQQRGEELIAQMKQQVASAQERISDKGKGKTVAYWFSDTKTPYFAGGLGNAAILSAESGLENSYAEVADDWPAGTWESLVEKNPDILVLGDLARDRLPGDKLADKEQFLATDGLTSTLTAVQNKAYIPLRGAELNPSIRFPQALNKIADYLEAQ